VTFAWPIAVGSVLWGLVAVPVMGWFALDRLTAAPDSPENHREAPTINVPRQQAWTLGIVVFGTLFVSLLLLPAIVAGTWCHEPESVSLAMATFFGFMIFIWGGLLFHHSRPEPDLEPL
jgi:hypothetical protein